MLEESTEQVTEITTELIDLEFLPTLTKVERGAREQSGVRAAADGHSTHGSPVRKLMTLSPTRGRARWRHGEDSRNDMIQREEESGVRIARSFCWQELSVGTPSKDRTVGIQRVAL